MFYAIIVWKDGFKEQLCFKDESKAYDCLDEAKQSGAKGCVVEV